MPKIKEMFAFVVADKDENDEGIMGIPTENGGWMPLVGADTDRVKSLKPFADQISKALNKPYTILHFKLINEVKL
jgi:hypothetical protein